MLGQIFVVADEAALGLPVSTVHEIRALLKTLPFTSTVALVANTAARLWPIRDNPAAQRQLLEQLTSNQRVLAAYDRFLSSAPDDLDERLYVLSEQQLQVLQRLVIEEAHEDESETWTPQQTDAFARAFLGVTSIVGEGSARVQGETRKLEDWVGFLTQNGSFNEGGQPLYALVRAHRLFIELARTEAVMPDESGDTERVHGLLPPMSQYLATTKLASKASDVESSLSAPRDYFVEGFARSKDNPLRLAWDGTPFLQRPFVRLHDGRLALSAPRALQTWLTDGWYYRLLDIAIDRGERDRFTTFIGFLFETYVLEVFELALKDRGIGSGRVHGEQSYASGEKTSDVAVDYGSDLLLFEVISRRLPLGVRTEADPQQLKTHLQRTLLDKIDQLDRVSRDILSGRASIPDVDRETVQRIWPVVVTAGDFTESEPLWAWLEEHLDPKTFEDPRLAELTVLGVGDIEAIAGLVGSGEELIDVIAGKARSDYRELSLARWLNDTRSTDPPRHPEIESRWYRLVAEMESVLVLSRTT